MLTQNWKGIFGKFQKAEIEAMQAQVDFAEHLEVGGSREKENQRLMSEMWNFKAIFLDMGDKIRNTFAKMANALSRCDGGKMKLGL